MSHIIGIDLGTTNSLAAILLEEGAEVIAQAGNSGIIPSVVSYVDGKWHVGEDAQNLCETYPEQTVYSIKRFMGLGIQDLDDVEQLPYQVIPAQRSLVKVNFGKESFTPQEISAQILKAIKRHVEQVLEMPCERVIITVPAYFDDAQRQATKDAGQIAGLQVERIINEPTAAALAYGLDQKQKGYVAVYDFGGGTFDVSILKLTNRVFKTLATCGHSRLGGDDLDQKIIEALQERHASLIANQPHSLLQQQLKLHAEQIKKNLSTQLETDYKIDLGHQTIEGVFQVDELNQLLDPLLDQTFEFCTHALKQAKLTKDQIDEVVLVGGSTVIPRVRHRTEEFFGQKPHIAIDPYQTVAIGAAIQGAQIAGKRHDFVLLDVIPLSLGIETLGGSFQKIILQNSTIPCQETEKFTTHADNQTAIEINIFQGERELVKDCRKLGKFKLSGIPPMPAGLPLVELTFEVDVNGALTVHATEVRSQTQAEIEVIPSHGLTQAEIDRIMEDSIEHAVDDFNARQVIDFRNTAHAMLRGISKSHEFIQKNLEQEEYQRMQHQIQKLQDAMKQNNPALLKQEIDDLGQIVRPIADAIMSQSILQELQAQEGQ